MPSARQVPLSVTFLILALPFSFWKDVGVGRRMEVITTMNSYNLTLYRLIRASVSPSEVERAELG